MRVNSCRVPDGARHLDDEGRQHAEAEWNGFLPDLERKLAGMGIDLTVEKHHESRLLKPNRLGARKSRCDPHPDWLVLVFEGKSIGSLLVAAPALRAAGAADDGSDYLYYEQHILECCNFARNLINAR